MRILQSREETAQNLGGNMQNADRPELRPADKMPRPLDEFQPPTQVAWSINVLVVDDDAADTNLILSALNTNEQVGKTMSLSNAEEALTFLAEGGFHPHLIFVDINMPRVDGFKFVEALKEIPWTHHIPVVFLTTSRLARDVERACNMNICRYIIKPDNFRELKHRLGRVVQQTVNGGWHR